MKRITRNALSLLLALVMLFTLAPLSAFADGVTEYDLWIAGVRVTSENCSSFPYIGGISNHSVYDPETNTLTLACSCYTAEVNGAFVYTTMENLNIKGGISIAANSPPPAIRSTGNITVVDDFRIYATGGGTALE